MVSIVVGLRVDRVLYLMKYGIICQKVLSAQQVTAGWGAVQCSLAAGHRGGGQLLTLGGRKAFLLTHPLLRGLKEVRWEVVR